MTRPPHRFAQWMVKVSLLLLLVTIAASSASAQIDLGTPKYGSFGGGPVDTINLANLNAHFVIKVFNKPGRGLPLNYNVTYDTTFWEPVSSGGGLTWYPGSSWGWNGSALSVGTINSFATGYDFQYVFSCETSYFDGVNTPHWFTAGYVEPYTGFWGCALYDSIYGIDYPQVSSISPDGAGYTFNADLCQWSGSTCVIPYSGGFPLATEALNSVDGNSIVPQGVFPLGPGVTAGSVVDRNGNEVSVNSSGTFTDTLGTTALTQSGGAPSPFIFEYTDSNGNPTDVTVTYTSYTVKTNFGCGGISEFGPTSVYLIDRVTLPNGSYYQFNYEATPSFPADVTGRLASITLPTGGTLSYTYTGGSNGIHCADGSAAGLTRVTPDGTWTYARSFGSGAASTTTVTDPSGSSNKTTIQFQDIYETQRDIYQGSIGGTPLRTIVTCYNGNTSSCPSTAISLPITERAITTTLGSSGLKNKHDYSYNGYGRPTETDDYDYGASVGSLLKKTLYTYASLGNINAFATTVTIKNPGGTTIAQTTYNYDGVTPDATSSLPQHVSVGGAPRGNLTSVNRWLNTTNTNVTTSSRYFDTGMLHTSTDADSNQTTYTYDATGSYLTEVDYPQTTTAGVPYSHTELFSHDNDTGLLLNKTDQNTQQTSYMYDNMGRPTSVSYPDSGSDSYSYNDSTPNPYVTLTKAINFSSNFVEKSVSDGLGRLIQTSTSVPTSTCSGGHVYANIIYDSKGHLGFTSNPDCSSTTTVGTTFQYDAVDRVTQITAPDGGNIGASYSGNCVTVTDQASKSGKSCADGLGRITRIYEDPSTLNYETDYDYNVLDNLISVAENSSRSRSYVYDSLSRLVSATNPESGTATYTYDGNGNVLTKISPKPNQTNSAVHVTATYSYDELNRLLTKGYDDGTPLAGCIYDYNDNYYINTIGRVWDCYNGNPSVDPYTDAALSYDQMGRISTEDHCFDSACSLPLHSIGSAYDLAGDLVSVSSDSGEETDYAINVAMQPITITNPNHDATHPSPVASLVTYSPQGAVKSLLYGSGITGTRVYDNRLQPCRMEVNSSSTILSSCTGTVSSGNIQDLSYGYDYGSTDNGNVVSWTGSGARNFTRTYTYDALNRINGLTDSTGGNPCPGLSWSYDAWGNRTAQTVTAGSCGSWSKSYTSSNQISGFSYDAAGNLIGDGTHTYAYDAENRLIQVDGGSTATYFYDYWGRRTVKTASSTTTWYAYSAQGTVIDEWQGGSTLATVHVYLGGESLAEYKSGTTYFIHPDHLGSARLVTNIGGGTTDSPDFLPFGEQIAGSSGTNYKFTGQERDAESGLDYFMARHYSSQFGSFMQPDPLGMSASDLTNPQSLNQYAYVGDNPTNVTDPSGMDWGDGGDFGGFGGGCDWCEGGGTGWGVPSMPGWSGTGLPGGSQGPDPASIGIEDWHTADNGYAVGDYAGELRCDNNGVCSVWDTGTGEWELAPESSPYAQQAMSEIQKALAPITPPEPDYGTVGGSIGPWGGSATITKSSIYVTPTYGNPGGSPLYGTVGYLNGPHDQADTDAFVIGHGVSACAFMGIGGCSTWAKGNYGIGSANEYGFGAPGAGAAYGHSFRVQSGTSNPFGTGGGGGF